MLRKSKFCFTSLNKRCIFNYRTNETISFDYFDYFLAILCFLD